MKVLFTGLGSIGKRHAQQLIEHTQDFELLAYRSKCRYVSEINSIQEYTNISKALEQNPDVAFITNPTHLHVSTALQCARADCHLLIEKPLSHTMSDVDTLIAEVDQRSLITQMGCQLRYDPILNQAREALQSGKFGSPLCFRVTAGSYLPDWRPSQDYRQSYSADPDMGGGVVLDLIHEIDYTYWLFGYPSQILSEIEYTDTLEIESEAIAEAILRMPNGVIGSIHLDYCRRQPQRKLEIVCEKGSIIADLTDQKLIIETESKTDIDTFDYDRNKRFRLQLEDFLQNINNNGSAENDIKEGKEVLKFALELKEEAIYD